jgi:hypothetical protein
MIRLASVWHGKDGYTLHIEDVPAWAYAIDSVNNSIIAAICRISKGWTCPLCLCNQAGWTFRLGWGKDEDGLRRHSLGGLLFRIGQRGGRFCLKRRREIYVRQLTFDEVCEHFADNRVEWDDNGEDYVRGVLVTNPDVNRTG